MARKDIAALVVLLICLVSCSGYDTEEEPNKDFDFLLFTQRWPETTCYEWMKRSKQHTCRLPSSGSSWTVHGIWPTRNGTKDGPFFCNRSMPFDMKEIAPLLPKLEESWTNVEKETPEDGLWKHEWEKHGTCASVLPPFHSENYYFGQGISWLQVYAMGPLLAKAGIEPDKPVFVGQIHNAIFGELKVNPVIECLHEGHGKQYITEIRICFNKDLSLRHCDGAVGVQTKRKYSTYRTTNKGNLITNCSPVSLIDYPSQVPKVRYYSYPGRVGGGEYPDGDFPWVKFYKFIKFLRWFTF